MSLQPHLLHRPHQNMLQKWEITAYELKGLCKGSYPISILVHSFLKNENKALLRFLLIWFFSVFLDQHNRFKGTFSFNVLFTFFYLPFSEYHSYRRVIPLKCNQGLLFVGIYPSSLTDLHSDIQDWIFFIYGHRFMWVAWWKSRWGSKRSTVTFHCFDFQTCSNRLFMTNF